MQVTTWEQSQADQGDLQRVDRQGAVEVRVTPLNLDSNDGDTLDFEVSMNTHSVDLSMDLVALSVLETDGGAVLSPSSWSGGSGHHVKGVLTFARRSPGGSRPLEGASRLTLSIRDLDVPIRRFIWDLSLQS